MRVFGHFIVILSLTAAAALHTTAQVPDANAVLAKAREALGGEKRLSGVKTLIATGRTRQVRGDSLVPIEFEIVYELPDKYVRKDEIPAQETGITSLGFNGDELIQLPPPAAPPMPAGPAGAIGGANPADAARRARVTTLKQDFARLMLGLFAGSTNALPLTFTYVAQAEAPQGKADVLEAKGPGNFTARLFLHAETHLPVMVTWQAAARGARPPGATPTPPSGAGPARGAGPGRPSAPAENRLYFAEYREVDGLQLPFRIRRAVGAETTEETTFDRFRINAKIDSKKFEVRK